MENLEEFGVNTKDPQKVILDYLNSKEKKQVGNAKGFYLTSEKLLKDLSGQVTLSDLNTFWSYAERYGIKVNRPGTIPHRNGKNGIPLYEFLDNPKPTQKPKQAPTLSSYDFTEEEIETVRKIYRAQMDPENFKYKDVYSKESYWFKRIDKESLLNDPNSGYTEELDAKLRHYGYITNDDNVLSFNFKTTDIEKLLYYEPSDNEIFTLSCLLQIQLKYPEDFHNEVTKESVLSLQEPKWSKYLYKWLLRKKFVFDGDDFEFNLKSNVLNYIFGRLQQMKRNCPELAAIRSDAFKLLHNIHDYTDLQYVDDTKTFTMVDDTKQVVISTPEGSLLDLNKVIN